MAFAQDLLDHQLEVISNFFALGSAWVTTKIAQVTSELIEVTDNDIIENAIHHPGGPHELEQIICRATINELNALVEFAMQNMLTNATGTLLFEVKNPATKKLESKIAIGLNRGKLEALLKTKARINVKKLPKYAQIEQIKELSEGFKHRQSLPPIPYCNEEDKLIIPKSKVQSSDEVNLQSHEMSLCKVSAYLNDTREFLQYCRSQSYI